MTGGIPKPFTPEKQSPCSMKQHLVISCGGRQATSLCVCVCHQMLCQAWNSRSCSHGICFQDVFVTISFTVRSDLFSTGPKYLFYHPLIIEPGLTPGQVVASQYQGLEENLKRCMHQDEGMKFAAGSCIFMYNIYIYVYTQHIDSKICGLWLIGS